MSDTEKKIIVDQLFQFFQAGEWDKATSLFSVDAKITQQFGENIKTNSVAEFIHKLKAGPLSHVGLPVYTDRNVLMLVNGGFVEKHKVELTIKNQLISLPVCILGTFDAEAKISSLEEYLDPSPIIKILSQH